MELEEDYERFAMYAIRDKNDELICEVHVDAFEGGEQARLQLEAIVELVSLVE